jgi:hypothetical protein
MGITPGRAGFLLDLSVLIEHFAVATAALSAGRREGGVMAEAGGEYNQVSDFATESAVSGIPEAEQGVSGQRRNSFLAPELHHGAWVRFGVRPQQGTAIGIQKSIR